MPDLLRRITSEADKFGGRPCIRGLRIRVIERDQCAAKFWLDPVQLAGSRGFRSHELNRVRALVIEHRAAFKEAWHGHFGTEAR